MCVVDSKCESEFTWVGLLSLPFPRLFGCCSISGLQLKIVMCVRGLWVLSMCILEVLRWSEDSEFGSLVSLLSNVFIVRM